MLQLLPPLKSSRSFRDLRAFSKYCQEYERQWLQVNHQVEIWSNKNWNKFEVEEEKEEEKRAEDAPSDLPRQVPRRRFAKSSVVDNWRVIAIKRAFQIQRFALTGNPYSADCHVQVQKADQYLRENIMSMQSKEAQEKTTQSQNENNYEKIGWACEKTCSKKPKKFKLNKFEQKKSDEKANPWNKFDKMNKLDQKQGNSNKVEQKADERNKFDQKQEKSNKFDQRQEICTKFDSKEPIWKPLDGKKATSNKSFRRRFLSSKFEASPDLHSCPKLSNELDPITKFTSSCELWSKNCNQSRWPAKWIVQ